MDGARSVWRQLRHFQPAKLQPVPYAGNNPLSNVDPLGLDDGPECFEGDPDCCDGDDDWFECGPPLPEGGGGGGGGYAVHLDTRRILSENLGLPPGMLVMPSDIAAMLQGAFGLPQPGCEFGACGDIFGFGPGDDGNAAGVINIGPFLFYVRVLEAEVRNAASKKAPNNGQPQQPQKKPCNGWTRAGGVLKAVDGSITTAAMVDLAAIHFWAGGFIIGVTCFTPEPAEPVACAAGVFAGGSAWAGGTALGYGAYLVAKDEMIPGVKQAITCEP
ncbi:MAG: hypothetical protein ABSG32_32190 [Terriglobia bacterium]